MNKKTKELTPIQVFKQKMLFVFMYNFAFGVVILSMLDVSRTYLYEGLWHKIFVSPIGNIPIGLIYMIILSILFGFLIIMFIFIDYKIYTKGLEFLKLKGEKKIE